MPRDYKRNIFRTSKFQRPILNIMISIAIVMLILITTSLAFLYQDITFSMYSPEKVIAITKATIVIFVFILPLILLGGIFWAYTVSQRLVGPFERILGELDDVIANNKKKHIHVRKNDELANEVTKRINAIIDRLP